MKVYVVTASAGEYSDQDFWIEAVFKKKSYAENFVALKITELDMEKEKKLAHGHRGFNIEEFELQ